MQSMLTVQHVTYSVQYGNFEALQQRRNAKMSQSDMQAESARLHDASL